MRLAVMADIHGNMLAFEAVLADLASVGEVDNIWILGDIAAMGTHPAACVAKIREMIEQHDKDKVQVIGGNADRYLVTGKRPHSSRGAKDAEALAKLITSSEDMNAALIWNLRQCGWEDYEFLAKILGQELFLNVPEYGNVIGVHAVPGDDEPLAFLPNSPDEEAADALLDREGRLALAGHTHTRMDRTVGRWRIVNPGSVGFSFTQSGRAEWALITFENGEAQVDLRGVLYDVDAAIAQADIVGYPSKVLLESRLRNQR